RIFPRAGTILRFEARMLRMTRNCLPRRVTRGELEQLHRGRWYGVAICTSSLIPVPQCNEKVRAGALAGFASAGHLCTARRAEVGFSSDAPRGRDGRAAAIAGE